MKKIVFPKNFYWGSSASAHQVEGNNIHSDWWSWEQKGNVKNKEVSGKACNFWYLYQQDLDLAKKLGHNAFRFSIEWAKVEPIQGKIDYDVLEHYQSVIDYCHKLNIEPFVTLHHFTNPKWFLDLGGWTKKKNIDYFLDYVQTVATNLKGIKYWITINEPCIYTNLSYYQGVWPPQKRNLFLAFTVLKNMINAHNRSYNILKKQTDCMVGFAKNNIFFEGGLLAKLAKKYWNEYFLDKTNFDFIGLNYYFHNKLAISYKWPFVRSTNSNKITSDIGWEIYPQGIYQVLMELRKYQKPIFITENGVADQKDRIRSYFIINHLKYIYKAIKKGVDIRGYLHWSLIDNFEWNSGFEPRFGLIDINYKNQKRTLRLSAIVYKKICQTGAIDDKLINRY